ncbi:MAG: cupin domain-containing protein [Phormidium sp. GEM2.Bin31]|nr:MAG: cupin domain-containing protein [Phormidium sp. GEM2.Bin31]
MATLTTADVCFDCHVSDLIEYRDRAVLSQVILKDAVSQYTLFSLGKDTDIEEHTATRNGAITVLEGEGTLTLNGKAIALKPGVFVFMPANAPHALKASENLSFLLTLTA